MRLECLTNMIGRPLEQEEEKKFPPNKTLFQQCQQVRSNLFRAATETDQIQTRHHGASQKNSCGVNTQDEGGKRRKCWQRKIWVRQEMSTRTDDKIELQTDATQVAFSWPKTSTNYIWDFQVFALNSVKRTGRYSGQISFIKLFKPYFTGFLLFGCFYQ